MHDPPELTSEAHRDLQSLRSIIPPEESEFDFEVRNKIADGADAYVSDVGDLANAAHVYIAKWRRGRSPTKLTPAGLSLFEGIVDTTLYEHSLRVATHGLLPCGDRAPVRFPQEAYSNVNDNPQVAAAELWGMS